MGNYLNHGAVAGNAVGFKLNSLWKITDTKGTKFGKTLIHILAEQLDNCWAELEGELAGVHAAARCLLPLPVFHSTHPFTLTPFRLSFENLRTDVISFQERMKSLETGSKNVAADAFHAEFTQFVKVGHGGWVTAYSNI